MHVRALYLYDDDDGDEDGGPMGPSGDFRFLMEMGRATIQCGRDPSLAPSLSLLFYLLPLYFTRDRKREGLPLLVTEKIVGISPFSYDNYESSQ